MLSITNKDQRHKNHKLNISIFFFFFNYRQPIHLKFLRLFKNFDTEGLDLTKYGRLFQMSILSKCKEFVTYTVDFAYVNDRIGSLLNLIQDGSFWGCS